VFDHHSHFEIDGVINGVEVLITVDTRADHITANLNTIEGEPSVPEVHNVGTYILTAINSVLKTLESPTPVATPAPPTPRLLDLSAYRKSLEDAEKGQGD
jgi:hypothetical protein